MRRHCTIVIAFALCVPSALQSQENGGLVLSDTSMISIMQNAVSEAPWIARAWPGFWEPPEFGVYRTRKYIAFYSPKRIPKGYQRLEHRNLPTVLQDHTYFYVGNSYLLSGGVIPLIDAADPSSAPQEGIAIPAELLDQYIPVGVELTSCSSFLCTDPLEHLLHEAFHSWQRGHYRNKYMPEGQFLDARQLTSEEITALELEKAALIAAVSAPDSGTLVRAYLDIRDKRFSSTPDLDVARERFQESNEGVAEFVGIAGAMWANHHSIATLGERINAGLNLRWNAKDPDSRHQMRVRTYVVGAALAFLIEECSADWRVQVTNGTPLDMILKNCVVGI